MARPRRHRRALAVLIAAWGLAEPGLVARATGVSVTDCGDSGQPGQLRAAITAAAPGDTIDLAGCTVVLAGAPGEDANQGGDVDVAGTLTIRGQGRGLTIVDGGGVDRVFHVLPGATLTLADLTIRHGQTAPGEPGGGVLAEGSVVLTGVSVSDNLAGSGGGIAVVGSGSLAATDVDLTDNEALSEGGGIFTEGGLTLTRVRLLGNRATDQGGGLSVEHSPGVVTIEDSTIAGNRAGSSGGGVYFAGAGTISRTTISGNSAGSAGGVNVVLDSTLSLTNVTLAHNVATESPGGGAMVVADGTTVTLVNATVALNADTSNGASGAGGIKKNGSVGLGLVNSIVALNAAGPSAAVTDVDPAKLGLNLANLIGGEPRLGPLADNGGPTLTMALLPGSPAIDVGSNAQASAAGLTTDQRGVPRVLAGSSAGVAVVDIGAVEAEPAPGGLLAIVPASGIYPGSGRLDVGVVLHAPGRTVAPGVTAGLDGSDMSGRLVECLGPGTLLDGPLFVRCGGLIGAGRAGRVGLPPGSHTLTATVPFTDGSSARATVVWEVLATGE